MKEIHLICNAHIDPIWQWDWQEGVSAMLSTFRSAVNLAREYDYIFCHNEVTVYKYVEEYAPELFDEIKELVKEGKWHIMGGWYLQPDCNMPSGETFVRQINEGKRYFNEKFGKEPTTAINFDPFGHSVGLVQIIKKCGQDSYIFMRPYKSELTLPAEQFIWRGLDGSEIKANRASSYATALGRSREIIEERAANQKEDVVCVLWGVGNHGGGPSRKDLGDIKELMETSADKYIHSTPEAFFERANPTAVFDKSLRISMPGCYTSMTRVKKKHAQLENEIYYTEAMLTVALSRGLLGKYPEEELHAIVEDLLNAEFHDVLPGTSIQCGEENGIKLLDHGLLEIERLKTRAFYALASTEHPAGEGEFPILVYNPNVYSLKTNVECEFMLADQNWETDIHSKIKLVDECGNEVKCQLVKEESNLNLDWRKRIIFEAELKPLAITRYSVYVDFGKSELSEREDAFVFDNGRKCVEIDKNTGLLKKYSLDGTDYLENACLPVMFSDNPDPWAMGKGQLLRVGEGEEAFMLSKEPAGVFAGMKSVQVIENGDIYLGIEAFFEKDSTRARIGYKIYKNTDYIDVDVSVYLGDVDKFVKLKLPISVKGELIGQCAFGTEKMFTDARENVSQRFIALDTGDKCLTVLNNCSYGSHFENNSLYLSLVRGVTYCAHPIEKRPIIPTDRFTKKIDQGETSYSFRIGVYKREHLERAALEFSRPPYALNVFPANSSVKQSNGFAVSLSDDSVTLVTMKKADSRDALIFRLINNTEHDRKTEFSAGDATIALDFGKYEVKTVIYENGSLSECSRMII